MRASGPRGKKMHSSHSSNISYTASHHHPAATGNDDVAFCLRGPLHTVLWTKIHETKMGRADPTLVIFRSFIFQSYLTNCALFQINLRSEASVERTELNGRVWLLY